MDVIKELKYTELKHYFNDDTGFENVEKIDVNEVIGQTTGAEALKFGLMVKAKGYNIYLCGVDGSGKTTFAKRFAMEKAKNEPIPPDLCYVYNFEKPNEPSLITFEAGKGREFKADMEELISLLKQELTKAFNSTEYEEEKERITKRFQGEKDDLMNHLKETAKEKNFGVRTGNGGVYFMPIIDGKEVSEEDYDSLDDETREVINEGSEEIQEITIDTMKKLRDIDKIIKEETEKSDYNIGLLTVGRFIMAIQKKYSDNKAVSDYLVSVKEDILDNLADFISETESGEEEGISMVMPWLVSNDVSDLTRYGVNLIVDNKDLKGAPVIVNYAPNYVSLVGEIEYDSENGNFTTDFTKIKPGILHKANGGYLILQASDLLSTSYGWECVKRVLKTGELVIEPIKEYQLGGITVAGIKPEAAPINVKIILVGSSYYYELLREYDDDFSSLFKVFAIFDYEMENCPENILGMLSFIKGFVSDNSLLMPTEDAIVRLMEYASRLAETQNKLTTGFSKINDILFEADTWARLDKADCITGEYIKKAIDKKYGRVNLYSKKYTEMMYNEEILIDTTGKKVGQINGLCVMETGDITFGMPTRITASTYMGNAGIVNIEKEAKMSGSIHDKGVQVITGYLGGKYADKFPLSLSCRICFEQNYNGVDGDSASSTELYAILSSLSNIPINQNLAVTGSVNQFGEIQPIGGVTYKIEGFFDLCKKRGFTGNQGVIIPIQNEKDLTLSDEVIEAVKNGKFHIYSISNIDEGIKLLLDAEAGIADENGIYPENTVHGKVYARLKANYDKLKEE